MIYYLTVCVFPLYDILGSGIGGTAEKSLASL